MAVLSAQEHVSLLKRAELQFRLTLAVRTACTLGIQPLKVPVVFTFGKKTVTGADMTLSHDEADEAAAVLEHTTTYALALQVVQAIKDVLGKPRDHADSSVRAAFEIARLVRNAYAHQPFQPHWSIDPDCTNKTFEVPGIARIDTTSLAGQRVRWQDYGGMLAMFRLSQYTRSIILPSELVSITATTDIGGPAKIPELAFGDVVQLGRMLMVKIDRVPDGATPINPADFQGPDGMYTFRAGGEHSGT